MIVKSAIVEQRRWHEGQVSSLVLLFEREAAEHCNYKELVVHGFCEETLEKQEPLSS